MHHATLTLCLAAGAGVILMIVAQRLGIPSIVVLLVGGVLLGPEALDLVDPTTLGGGLETVIAVAVAVILFEGGLTLDWDGYRRAPTVIRRMLTMGALVTWLATGGLVLVLFDLEPGMALMAGSLFIVTGPTVVSPLLRRLHIRERLHHILYWEGVLIDAVGVLVAVLCYEWLTPNETFQTAAPIARFALRILIGVSLGASVGLGIALVLKRQWVSAEHVNIFVLACALLTYSLADAFLSESGLLAVVVAGLVVGVRRPAELKHVRRFKLELTELGIGTLFVLLAAKLDLARFAGLELLVLLALVMFAIRPLVVWIATAGEGLELREKALLSWIAPRGIVAAAMASLFSIRLQEVGYPEAIHLETFTYAVIIATVTLQGLSAPLLVRLLGLQRRDRRKWVVLGETKLVSEIGRGLRRAGVGVVELSGPELLEEEPDLDDPRFADAGAVLCAGTTMLQNVWVAHRWGLRITDDACFRWATFEPQEEAGAPEGDVAGRSVWRSTVTAAAVEQGLLSGSHSIEVIEVGQRSEPGRFGRGLQPLFWVQDGRAHIIPDPLEPGPPQGDLAVALRSRITGLAGLVAHVDIVHKPESSFVDVLQQLAASARRMYPRLNTEKLVEGIVERLQTMPASVGGGLAIPHGYSAELQSSRCFLAVVPRGVSDMEAPDDAPVRLVFLLVSPEGKATEHLESLAALALLGQEPGFIDLLCDQQVPERVMRLIAERG